MDAYCVDVTRNKKEPNTYCATAKHWVANNAVYRQPQVNPITYGRHFVKDLLKLKE